MSSAESGLEAMVNWEDKTCESQVTSLPKNVCTPYRNPFWKPGILLVCNPRTWEGNLSYILI